MRGAWRELAGQARYFFQTPEWIELAAPRLGPDVVWSALHTDTGAPAAVTVLRHTRRRAGHVPLELLSQVRLGESQLPYADGLLDPRSFDGRDLRELANLSGPWHVLWLTGLRRGSPWLELDGRGALVREEQGGGVAILDTSAAAEECWRAVPKHMRHAVHTARHRIAASGGAQMSVATGAELAGAYDAHVELEAAGWKGRAGTSLAERPFDRELLRDYLQRERSAQVRALRIGGRLAATQVATTVARTVFLRRIAYDEELASCSPSNVLLADLLESCCADPEVDRIDCLSWQPWNARWGMSREPTYELVAFNQRTFRGAAARISRGGWEHAGRRRAHRRARSPAGAAPQCQAVVRQLSVGDSGASQGGSRSSTRSASTSA